MSARIPDTLLVSEVLKPTGFDCPEDLEGVSFNEAVSGGTSAELEDNKEVSITENGTIEITPTAGHDYAGMKKVTANVNVAGGADIEANKQVSLDIWDITGTTVEITPSQSYSGMEKATVKLGLHASLGQDFALCDDDNGHGEQVLIERPLTVGKKAWNVHDGVLYTITGIEDTYFTTDGGEGTYIYPPHN